MTPAQKLMCQECKRLMSQFYENPENEKRFQEWKKGRDSFDTINAPSPCSHFKPKLTTANHTA